MLSPPAILNVITKINICMYVLQFKNFVYNVSKRVENLVPVFFKWEIKQYDWTTCLLTLYCSQSQIKCILDPPFMVYKPWLFGGKGNLTRVGIDLGGPVVHVSPMATESFNFPANLWKQIESVSRTHVNYHQLLSSVHYCLRHLRLTPRISGSCPRPLDDAACSERN